MGALFQESSTQSTATQFLTIQTLFTAAGSATAVFTVTSVVRALLPRVSPRWVAAVLALCLTIVGIRVDHQSYGPTTLLLAVINAAIVYSAAVGVNNITTGSQPAGNAAAAQAAQANVATSFRWWA